MRTARSVAAVLLLAAAPAAAQLWEVGNRLPANLAGAVQILYGALFADGFERGTAAGWSPL